MFNSDPDYSQIIEGCMVLAKYKDDLWYKGRVEDIIKGTEFSVKFLHCNDVLLLNLHCVYPLGITLLYPCHNNMVNWL